MLASDIDVFDPLAYAPPTSALDELRAIPHWVSWKYFHRPGAPKPTKPPVDPNTGGAGNHSDPKTWAAYEKACWRTRIARLAGVGFVLTDGDGLTGIDLDACRNVETGELETWAAEIVELAETYAEVSPSGTGVRLLARGKVESTTKCDPAHVEIYGSHRYLTITGNHIEDTPEDIRPAPQTIERLLARVAAHAPQPAPERKPAVIRAAEKLPAGDGKSFFRAVNERALANLDLWVTAIFPRATKQGSGGFRVKSKDLGRDLQEDIGFDPGGIIDFGVADMGDPNHGKRTAIDMAIEWGGAEDATAAAHWLCDRLGVTPEALGWRDEQAEIAALAAEIGRTLNQDGAVEPGMAAGAPLNRRAHDIPVIRATPFRWPDCSSIPPREWVYGDHLIRGFVSATVAPGGVGKSSLLFAEAASMASGRALLHGVAPATPLNVWIWNGEDPTVELERRLSATMKFYGIRRQDCQGQLYIDSGREMKIVIAETQKSGTVIIRPVVDAIKAAIIEHKIDVVVIDPFVSSHRVPENDNTSIDAIAREWADIADKTNCAIELVHHVRKVGDVEVTVEMARGASALISAARSARVLNQMTSDEGEKAGVENRRLHFRVNSGKSNMSPSSEKATWFRMCSVDLDNGGQLPFGDSIGVVTAWRWPDPLDDITARDLIAVQSAISTGEWRENSQAKDWAGHAVADALKLDVGNKQCKSKIAGLLKIWIKNGALVVIRRPDKNGDERPFIEVGRPADE